MDKIKRFFTEKPEGNIWKRAFIYLLLFRYFFMGLIFLSIPFLAGLLVPNQQIIFDDIGKTLAESFTLVLNKIYEAGSFIGANNPFISKILVFGLANIFWVYYLGLAVLIIDVARHITSYIYSRRKMPRRRKTTYKSIRRK